MRTIIGYIATSICLLIYCGQIGAQQITASVDKNPVGQGDKFHFTITVRNAQGNIAMPDLKEFNVMSGPNQTSRVQIINGAREETYTLSWLLFPKRKGTFTIKPINRGSSLTYSPVTVEVIEGMPSTEPPIESQRTETKDHFGKIYVSNTEPYLGEQITATYVIYNSIRGFNPQYDFANTLEGFWKEELKVEPKWSDKLENINGRNYQKAVIARQILFPQKSGELAVDPFEVNGTTGGFFRQKRVDFKSNRAIINVKPLPSGAPETFKGAVGNFDFDFEVDKTEVETNEAFNLSITISGKGNLSLVNELPVEFPSDFEVYDPEIKDRISKTANGMSGSRTFEYLIIPRHSGTFEIDGVSFTHFDPKGKKYRTQRAEDLVIEVKKTAEEMLTEGPTIIRKEDVKILESDIRYISSNTELQEIGSSLFGSAKYVGSILTPALGFLLFLFIRKRKQEELADVEGSRRKRAGKVAAKHLLVAQKALDSGDTSLFYEELHSGLTGYLSDKILLSNSQMDKESVREALSSRNVKDLTINSFLDLLNNCEMARYAPSASTEPMEMMKQSETIIHDLEGELS
ncbi:MAG: protein BatD [Flavobacteriales bacterium]|nr:protein BatD [Flavobacteriales bacterium]